MSMRLSPWQAELNRHKKNLLEAIGTVYGGSEGDFWVLCEQAGLSCKRDDLAGTTFPQRLNWLFSRLPVRVPATEVRGLLAALRENIKIESFAKEADAVISLIDQGISESPTYKKIPLIEIKIPAGSGPDRGYERKVALAESVVADAESKLAGQKTESSQAQKCPGQKGTPCTLPSLSVDFISHVASWEQNIADTMEIVADLREIQKQARAIIMNPPAETAGIEREKLRSLLIFVDRFLLSNDFPVVLSADLGTEAEAALSSLLSRAKFPDSAVILEALFRSLAFIREFADSGELGRNADNQQEFERQFTDLLAYLTALQQSLYRYAQEVLRKESEGFAKALANVGKAPSPVRSSPTRGSSDKPARGTNRIRGVRVARSSTSSDRVDQVRGGSAAQQ